MPRWSEIRQLSTYLVGVSFPRLKSAVIEAATSDGPNYEELRREAYVVKIDCPKHPSAPAESEQR